MHAAKLLALRRWAPWLISSAVLGLALAAIGHRLGDGSLYDWDEAIYAEVAREMLLSDTWMTLTWNGLPFFHKPPLPFWLTALTYKIFGVTEWTARLWSAMFGFGVVVLTFILGLRMRSWVVGVTAALVLLVVDQGYYGFWWNFLSLSRVGMLDTGLTFWIMTTLLVLWEAEHRPRLLPLCGLSIGMAVMTKAWPGFLGAAIAFLYWLLSGQRRIGDRGLWALAAGLAGLLIVPWHVWQLVLHGQPFVQDYGGVNLTSRVFQSFEGNTGNPLHYIDILRRGLSIWGYVWPLAYLWGVWRAIAQGDRQMTLLVIWITLPLLLFSAAQTKLGWYISMIYPAIALLLGLVIVELCSERWALVVTAIVVGVCYLRVPAVADGSPDVKQFALQARPWIVPAEPVYVLQEVCSPHTRPFSSNAPDAQASIVRPSLRFYMQSRLTCLEEAQALAGSPPRQAQVIIPQAAWPRLAYRGDAVLAGHGFVLARWE